MKKADLINVIAEQTGVSKKDTDAVIKAFTENIKESLAKGEDVSLLGFGTFSVSERAARNGKNPLTGEPMEIAACKVPKWKPAKAVKEAVNKQ